MHCVDGANPHPPSYCIHNLHTRFGLDASSVRLGWYVDTVPNTANPRGDAQLFYEVQVHEAAAPTAAAPVWTSTKTASADMQLIVPASAALKEGTAYTWNVRVWLSSNPTTPTAWGCGTGGEAAPFDTAPSAESFPGDAGWIGGGGQLKLKGGT